MNSRIAILAIAAAAAFGCTSQEIVEPEDKSVKVIMNSLVTTDYEDCFIYLSASKVSETERLREAKVTVSVNGGAPVTATETDPGDDYYSNRAIPYYYNGSFNPGDHIRIDATTKYGHVSSEIHVPDKVNIVKVDTTRVTIRGSGYNELNLRFKISVKDKPGENNFYRFRFFKEECYERNPGEGKTREKFILEADGSADPILSEGYMNTGDILSSLLEMENNYLLFNDDTFDGETKTLSVTVNMSYLLASFSFMPELPDDYDDPYVYVVLEHISFAEYHYLKALNNLSNLGYDAVPFFEPTTIPSNVDGGLGFVSVATDSDPVKIRIPEDMYMYEVRYRKEHPEEDPYYNY